MKRSVDIVVVCSVGGFVVVCVVVVVSRVKAADMLSLLATALRGHELLLPMKFLPFFGLVCDHFFGPWRGISVDFC